MVTWDSHNPSPPSLLFPADSSKWWVRRNLPGTLNETAPNGKSVCIVELRGWLRTVGTGCNGVDPDWHYDLELDPEWLDELGINLEALLLPGDTVNSEPVVSVSVNGEVTFRSSDRAKLGEPIMQIELDGWQRTDTYRGQPAKPASWTFTNECNTPAAVWPYDPRNPKAGDPALAVGQYVRVVGSLVTDEPHMEMDMGSTNLVLTMGYAYAVQTLGKAHADSAELNAIKWLWSDGKGETDELNPARYNEVHSPDFFAVLSPKDHTETIRTIAIVAKNGLISGDTEQISAEIHAPTTSPSRWAFLNIQKRLGPSTLQSSVLLDVANPITNGVSIQVHVQGAGGLGPSGKYFAVYRVGWRGIAPQLSAAVSGNGSVMMTAADGAGLTMAKPGNSSAPFWPSAWLQIQSGKSQSGGSVAVTSRAPGYFDAFTVGADRNVYTAATSGGPWAGWWGIPGLQTTAGTIISAASRSANKLDVFVADGSGRVMTSGWDPSAQPWHPWTQVLNGATVPGGAIGVVSRRQDVLDLFTVAADGQVWTASAMPPSPTGWHGWWAIPGIHTAPGAPIACLSRSLDKLDIFVADAQGRVMSAAWNPTVTSWQGWWQIQGGVTAPGAPIAAVSRRPDFLDIFVAAGSDGTVYTAAWSPQSGAWAGWWPIPGIHCRPGTPLLAFSPQTDVIVVVTSTQEGNVVSTFWSPATGVWAAWSVVS